MQRAQLDLQRQQLVKTDQLLLLHENGEGIRPELSEVATDVQDAGAMLLRRLQKPGVDVLDLRTLALFYAGRRELEIGPREAGVLLRSALHHGVDTRPWLDRVGSPEEAVAALARDLESYPRAEIRQRIANELAALPSDEATDLLVRIALTDDAPDVRSVAAIAAVQRGRAGETMTGLADDLRGPDHAAALEAFVSVADTVGLPDEIGQYPKMPVLLALAWRRWRARREAIVRQVGRAALGGVLVSFLGASTPLFYYLAYPEDYHLLVQGTFPLPAWMFSGVLMFLLIGCLQGAASGLALGVADAVWHDMAHRTWRWAWGIGSGLALALLLTLLSFWRVSDPDVGPGVFVPVYLLYGVAFGAAATITIPPLGTRMPIRLQLRHAARAIPLTAATTVLYAFVVFPSMALETVGHRLLFAVGFPLALALLFGRRSTREDVGPGAHQA
jgi:hypothetical protein